MCDSMKMYIVDVFAVKKYEIIVILVLMLLLILLFSRHVLEQ